ncbi:MAG: hypothetical protein ACI4JD_05965 [Ruminococcus sp.]
MTDAVNEQVEIWKNESKEFRIAHETGNLYDEGKHGNMFQAMAGRAVFNDCYGVSELINELSHRNYFIIVMLDKLYLCML